MKNLLSKLITLKPFWVLGLFILLDIICIGMGMGVPFFCILLGLPVGWIIVKYITARTIQMKEIFRKVLLYSAVTAAVTLLGMCLIWLPISTMLFDPGNDLSTTGVPLILYEPRASFIGWLVLMIVISPVLQLLTTLFSSYLTLLSWLGKTGTNSKV
ncbi:MAG: hypothetical protein WBV22_08985 [Anaerolineaceae bacterium]